MFRILLLSVLSLMLVLQIVKYRRTKKNGRKKAYLLEMDAHDYYVVVPIILEAVTILLVVIKTYYK